MSFLHSKLACFLADGDLSYPGSCPRLQFDWSESRHWKAGNEGGAITLSLRCVHHDFGVPALELISLHALWTTKPSPACIWTAGCYCRLQDRGPYLLDAVSTKGESSHQRCTKLRSGNRAAAICQSISRAHIQDREVEVPARVQGRMVRFGVQASSVTAFAARRRASFLALVSLDCRVCFSCIPGPRSLKTSGCQRHRLALGTLRLDFFQFFMDGINRPVMTTWRINVVSQLLFTLLRSLLMLRLGLGQHHRKNLG